VAAVFAGGCGQGENSLCDRAVPEANLRLVDLSGCDLSFKILTKADFSGANLSGANLQNTNLQGANLERANLQDAKLTAADLSGADLTGADIEGANLLGAVLKGTVLVDADLQDANLKNADLSGADLTGADIEGANLLGAVLKGAVLVDIVGIPIAGPAKFGVFQKKKEGRSTEAGKKLTAEEAAAVLAYWIGEWEYKFQRQLDSLEEDRSSHIERWVFRWKEKGKSIEGSGRVKFSEEEAYSPEWKMGYVEEFDAVKGVFISKKTIYNIKDDEGQPEESALSLRYDPITRTYHEMVVSPKANQENESTSILRIKNPDLVTWFFRKKIDGDLLSMDGEWRRLE
jgi:hypothetical protein